MEYVDLQVRVPLRRAIERLRFSQGSRGGGSDDKGIGSTPPE